MWMRSLHRATNAWCTLRKFGVPNITMYRTLEAMFPHERHFMGDAKEIDHELTDEIVCPNCGYKLSDSFEFDDGDGADCPECNCEFKVYVCQTITYSTKLVKAPRDTKDGVETQLLTAAAMPLPDEDREDDMGDASWVHDSDMGARG